MDMDYDDTTEREEYGEYEYNASNVHELEARIADLKKSILAEDDVTKREELSCELLALKDEYDKVMGISSFKGR